MSKMKNIILIIIGLILFGLSSCSNGAGFSNCQPYYKSLDMVVEIPDSLWKVDTAYSYETVYDTVWLTDTAPDGTVLYAQEPTLEPRIDTQIYWVNYYIDSLFYIYNTVAKREYQPSDENITAKFVCSSFERDLYPIQFGLGDGIENYPYIVVNYKPYDIVNYQISVTSLDSNFFPHNTKIIFTREYYDMCVIKYY